MSTWTYTIQALNASIMTTDVTYAERKSKSGYRVICKRTPTIRRF